MSLISNFYAQAQFSYSHSDGMVISCAEKPLRTYQFEPFAGFTKEDIAALDLPEEEKEIAYKFLLLGAFEVKIYATIVNGIFTVYQTEAFVSSPQKVMTVSIQQADIKNINANDYYYMLADSYIDFSIGFSKINTARYQDIEGVKTKETDNFEGDFSLVFSFGDEKTASDFIDKIINLLDVSEADREGYRYLMKRVPTDSKPAQNVAEEEPTMSMISEKGGAVTINGKVYYKYNNKFYGASFDKFGKKFGTEYTINGQVLYTEDRGVVYKNKQIIAYTDMSDAFTDASKSQKYLNKSKGVIYKFGRQIATYESVSTTRNDWDIKDLVILIDYLGL